jgi:hypothetical protein
MSLRLQRTSKEKITIGQSIVPRIDGVIGTKTSYPIVVLLCHQITIAREEQGQLI